jgi:AcrR family transcriptional regulator
MPRPYHHGDLREALIDGAVTLIAERGVQQFSVAELSRRVGVTTAAPYRHFANREDLLAAVAVQILRRFRDSLAARVSKTDPPEERLAAIADAYVRFAAEQPALFAVVFDVGLDRKQRYSDLRRAYEDVEGMLGTAVAELCPDDARAADQLADAIEATAHGYAALLTDEPSTPTRAEIVRVAAQAARATRALIQGRAALLQ